MIKEPHQNSCNYADELVSYLYDEIGKEDKAHFESHLSNCASCADELADFSLMRSSIVEWRDTEFQPLETPVFQLPNQKSNFKTESSNTISLTARIRALFSLSPAWASAATAAAFVFFLGILLVAVSFQREQNIAQVENKAATQNSPLQEKVAELEPTFSNSNKETVTKELPKPPIIEPQKAEVENKKITVKNVQPSKIKNRKAIEVETAKPSKLVFKNSNQSPPPTLLADEDEFEDDSLRLSDLFRETGGK